MKHISTSVASDIHQLPVDKVTSLEGYKKGNFDFGFEFDFHLSKLPKLGATPACRLTGVDITGRIEPGNPRSWEALGICAQYARSLGRYGSFAGKVYFERQTPKDDRRTQLAFVSYPDKARFSATYWGEKPGVLPEIAKIISDEMSRVGLPVKRDGDSLHHLKGQRAVMTGFEIHCDLLEIPLSISDDIKEIYSRIALRPLFYSWFANINDREISDMHGYEYFNEVVDANIPADSFKVTLKLQFLELEGVDIVRQLCEGEAHYTIPLGSFRHRKKRSTIGIFTSGTGYRFALEFKEEPTEEEFQQIEADLGVTFERQPFA